MSAEVGAVLDVQVERSAAPTRLAAWAEAARSMAAALGWSDVALQTRLAPGTAHLFLPAPIDQLMTATDVNEAAWVVAEAGVPMALDELRQRSASECAPRLVAMQRAAQQHGISFSLDDETVSVGSGARAKVWPRTALPDATAVDWSRCGDIPMALVTGSNGKTTTARLIAAMLESHGHVVGISSTEGVRVAGESVATGDYSGPAGARLATRDARVTAAVLETARGGMLRRGLGLTRAAVAIITNIVADHFGEYGIHDVASLVEAKLIVARALGASGTLVLNADDRTLRQAAERLTVPIVWFSRQADDPFIRSHIARGGLACVATADELLLHKAGQVQQLGRIAEMPIAHQGAAVHNVSNALGAVLVATRLGASVSAIRTALHSFGARPEDNAGRLDIRQVHGITVIIDYAHNPAGMQALCAVAAQLPAARRVLVLGQAGNRDDAALRELAETAWTALPWDRVLIKSMPSLHRGREAGEVERVLREALLEAGAVDAQVEIHSSELLAAQHALRWAEAGDLVVLPLHAERAAVLAWLDQLTA